MQEAFEFEKKNLATKISAWEQSDSDKGQVYTRPEVVELMLTAMGLNTCDDLENVRILEPGFVAQIS